MPDRTEAAVLALDAYQRHLLPELTIDHRDDRVEAQVLIRALVTDLCRYAEHNQLDVGDLLDELLQARTDRGGFLTKPSCSFRLDAEVQFRSRKDTSAYRGFISQLTADHAGQAECVLRIPGIADLQHVRTTELEPAIPMTPLSTRTAGTAFTAGEAEQIIISIISDLGHGTRESDADPKVLADLTEMSTALAIWSGTTPEQVLWHLRHQASAPHPHLDQAQSAGQSDPSAARRAATAFPDSIAASISLHRPETEPFGLPAPPAPGSRRRLR